jgi:hypothetical protein
MLLTAQRNSITLSILASMAELFELQKDILGSSQQPGSLPWTMPQSHWEDVLSLAWELMLIEPVACTKSKDLIHIHRVACEVIMRLHGEPHLGSQASDL